MTDPSEGSLSLGLLQRQIEALSVENERLKSGDGGGTSGGMDPWQTSVEKRLDSLDGRMARVETNIGLMKVDLATLTERVAHLPGKGFVVTSAVGAITAVTTLLILLQKIGVLH